MLFTLLATVAPSLDQASASGKPYYVKINSGTLNIRNKPSTTGSVVTKLAKGQQLTVATISKGWAKVTANGKQGYVSTAYIAPKAVVAAAKPVAQAKTVVASTTAVKSLTSDYRTKAIAVAKSNLGVKYKWAGYTPSGFDCSGLVNYSFSQAGVTLPRTAAEMFTKGTSVTSYMPGDLLFYATSGGRKVTHVAIYIGNGQMIHSATSKGVSIANLNNVYWKPKLIGAKRI